MALKVISAVTPSGTGLCQTQLLAGCDSEIRGPGAVTDPHPCLDYFFFSGGVSFDEFVVFVAGPAEAHAEPDASPSKAGTLLREGQPAQF